jgi:hypothetical protein
VTGRNENLAEATGTASRLRRRAGRRQRQSRTEAGLEASCEEQIKVDRSEGDPSEEADPATCPAKRRDAVPVTSDRLSLRPVTSLPPPRQGFLDIYFSHVFG